jgi:integrase/recombinase XerD
VKNLYSFLPREGFLETDPMARVKLPRKPQTVVVSLSDKNAEKLLARPDKSKPTGYRDYAMMATFIDTAMRLSEVTDLDLHNVDYEENLLNIRGKMLIFIF